MIKFASQLHKKRFSDLLDKYGHRDAHTTALFYIIAHDVFKDVEDEIITNEWGPITIKPEALDNGWVTHTSDAYLRFAFTVFTGRDDWGGLNSFLRSRELIYTEALKIRLSIQD